MKKTNHYDTIILLFIILSIVAILTIAGLLFHNHFMNTKESVESGDFLSLIAAIFSVTIAITIPKYLVKSECYEHLHDEGFCKSLDDRYATKTELFRLDAHLSRMNAVHLSSKYPIWAIGWAFRTLKRYQRLPDSNIAIYDDFLKSIDYLISSCQKKIVAIINSIPSDLSAYNQEAVNKLIDSELTPIEGDEIRVIIRAIKDIFDYLIYININNKNTNKKTCNSVLSLLFLLLNIYHGDKHKTDVQAVQSSESLLCNKICEISDYAIAEKDNGEEFFEEIIKKYINTFYKKFEEEQTETIKSIMNEEDFPVLFEPKMSDKIKKKYAYVELV